MCSWRITLTLVFAACALLFPACCQAADEESQMKRVAASTDVAWLEKIAGSLNEATKLDPHEHLGEGARAVRTEAYARLGALGTPKSLAVVARIEAKAKGQSLISKTVPLGTWTSPSWHCSNSEVAPIAQVTTPEGVTYALIRSVLLAGYDLYLISTRTPDKPESWSRPLLIPERLSERLSRMRDTSLTLKEKDTLIFTYTAVLYGDDAPPPSKQEMTLSLPAILKDTDKDGWTDAEESRLGLDAAKADTDGDGIADGADVCPNYAPVKKDAASDEVQILQKVFFATYGLTDSRELLLVQPNARKAQMWGYRGPVIYLKEPHKWDREEGFQGIFVSWSVTIKGDTAEVYIGDYIGPTAAGSMKYQVKKIHGAWYVVKREFGPVA